MTQAGPIRTFHKYYANSPERKVFSSLGGGPNRAAEAGSARFHLFHPMKRRLSQNEVGTESWKENDILSILFKHSNPAMTSKLQKQQQNNNYISVAYNQNINLEGTQVFRP